MAWLFGGDDEGVWGVTTAVPAEVRPLSGYLDPDSHVYRCPADDGPNPWDRWRLVTMRQDGNFKNTVIRYFANEYDAEEERKKFLENPIDDVKENVDGNR